MVSAINPQKLSKAAVTMGGLLVLAGLIFVSVVALILTPAFDIDTLKRVFVEYRILLWGVLLAIGILDIISGIILRHR
jgi:UDP-N-acetylmuramyl pentapeptide phosphotransferase/UDP-N-acetylglucosamine-1-phosphate transferase